MTVIVDYGLGNLGSIANILKKAGDESVLISGEPERIRSASKLILPGVGHFDKGMANLRKSGLVSLLEHKALEEKVPVLGICLGMQLMAQGSEEGASSGLGWVQGHFKRFQGLLKVPHMGWNWVRFVKSTPLTAELETTQRFYFVHSYHMAAHRECDVLAVCDYGVQFPAAFQVGNLYGVQFHPEKSHRFGLALMQSFAQIGLGLCNSNSCV